MKDLSFLLSSILVISATVVTARSQQDNVIVSDEFHFMAVFPEKPTESNGELETRFGTGSSRLWVVQRPDISYEVSVTDFPDLSVSMDTKSLNKFYNSICLDIAARYGNPSCDGAAYIIENEEGRGMYFRKGSDEATRLYVWLAQKRLYQVSVSYKKNKFENDPVLWKQLNDFLDAFLLIKKSNEKDRYTVGLPPPASQNLKNPELN